MSLETTPIFHPHSTGEIHDAFNALKSPEVLL